MNFRKFEPEITYNIHGF